MDKKLIDTTCNQLVKSIPGFKIYGQYKYLANAHVDVPAIAEAYGRSQKFLSGNTFTKTLPFLVKNYDNIIGGYFEDRVKTNSEKSFSQREYTYLDFVNQEDTIKDIDIGIN